MQRCVGISQRQKNERAENKTKYTCFMKKSCHSDKKKWLENKGDEPQQAAVKNDVRVLYCIVWDLTETGSNASTPIKDKSGNILLDINVQDLHWIEHFKETLNQHDPTVTTISALMTLPKN